MNKRLFDLIVLGLWLLIAIVVYIRGDIYTNGYKAINASILSSEKEIPIEQIFVLDSNLFEIVFAENSKTIISKVDSDVDLSRDEMILLFKKIKDPRFVFIFKNPNDTWLVKINFFLDGRRTSLDKWILEKTK